MSKAKKIKDFNPNGVGLKNGNLFGLPFTEDESEVVIMPVPWDVTSSHGNGSANGPKAILEASSQLDLYDPDVKDAWKMGVYMFPISEEWQKINEDMLIYATPYISFLEDGGKVEENESFQQSLDIINEGCLALQNRLKERAAELLGKNKIVGILGGEHSVSLSLMESLGDRYSDFGILQIDAHADLRNTYEGFENSHASVMFNALKIDSVSKLVQVGVRDICQEEMDLIKSSNDRVKCYFDWDMKKAMLEGVTWKEISSGIIRRLPENVYVSFDIDGLQPSLCPNTGTPVPGGLSFEQVYYLLNELVDAGKKIIGFDLCEVSPGKDNEWDANVGARILYKLANLAGKSHGVSLNP